MYTEVADSVHYLLPELLTALKQIDLTRGGASYISPREETTAIFRPIFQDHWLQGGSFALVALLPSQQLVGHADAPISGMRYHIPLVTNSGCWSYHDGMWQQLEVGTIYRMNPAQEHGAVNWGQSTRVNLMVDLSIC